MDRNIILLFGGDSDERLVSVASAQAMAQEIRPDKLWFWHREGPIFDIKYDELMAHKNPFTNEFKSENKPIFNTIKDAVISPMSQKYIFLLAVHGGSGENGELQKLFEQHKRHFTGSGAQASLCAFNKVFAKEALKKTSIKLAPHRVFNVDDQKNRARLLEDFFAMHGEIIVKPVCGGSSIGCFFIRSLAHIPHIQGEITRFGSEPFLVEKVIHGREISVGVMETSSGSKGLSGTEVVLEKNRDFDYQGKYLGMGSKEITPATLAPELMKGAQLLAENVHDALKLRGYSRTDMILSDDGFYFLEVNTLPGMSKTSIFPQQLRALGLSMKEFLALQIEIALKKNSPQTKYL